MANFPVDPRPLLPVGFTLEDPPLRPPLRHEVFVAGCYTLKNEDLAIVKLVPPVNKTDFHLLAEELHKFFRDIHCAPVIDVQQCAIGDAYVRFCNPLDREKFLGPTFQFGSYSMTVVKHDEGDNARTFDLYREAWIMLVAFPEDLRCASIIAKCVSHFGILVHWHESSNLSRDIVKVFLNNEAIIPDSVKVNAGLPSRGRSWTVPTFVLQKKGIVEPPEEEAVVTVGPLHPLPPEAPRWNGFGFSNHTAGGSTYGRYTHMPLFGRFGRNEGTGDNLEADSERTNTVVEAVRNSDNPPPAPFVDRYAPISFDADVVADAGDTYKLRSVVVGSVNLDFSVDVETSNVKRKLFPEISNPEVKSACLEMLEEEEDDEVIEIPRPSNITPRKKRAKKLKEPLDSAFLRRSKSVANKIDGFKGKSAVEILNPKPLAIIKPSDKPAPYLNKEVVEGIATGFLQIYPGDVSDALIRLDCDE